MALEIVLATVEYIMNNFHNGQMTQQTRISFDIMECLLGALSIYAVTVYGKLINRVVSELHPDSIANSVSFLMFIAIIQRYIVEIVFKIDEGKDLNWDAMIVVNNTILSIELIFIVYPLSHNLTEKKLSFYSY